MLVHPLLLAIGVAAIFGTALVVLIVNERRRRSLRQHLGELSASARAGSEPAAALLRRPQPRDSMRGRTYPRMIRERLDTAYAAAGGRIGPFHLTAAAFVAGGAVLALCGGVMGLSIVTSVCLTAAAALGAMYMLIRQAQAKFRAEFLELFPEALDLIVRAVRAGLPVLDAMAIVAKEIRAPVGPEFQKVLEQMRIGVDMGIALQRTADRIRVPDFQFYVASLALQRRTGGGLAETLGNLSNIIRRRRDLRIRARTLSAEAKTSAMVLSILPVVGAGGLFMVNSTLMWVLFTDPRGRFMLGVAVCSLAMGVLSMMLMIRRMLR